MTTAIRPSAMRWLSNLVRIMTSSVGPAVAVVAMLAGSARADALKVGDRLAELDGATDTNGKAVRLKAFKGRWVVVTIGASWCKPCAKELPVWDRIAGEVKDKIVFVAIDVDDDAAVGKRFHDKLKLRNFQRVYLSPNSAVAASYGSEAMPSTFVADDKGVVRLVHARFEEGDPDGEYRKFKDALAKLVK
jgi:thiol-disulfide isomerase/thioredoxin